MPTVSVFTASHRTGRGIHRPWRSLLAQTASDWEWVVVDDSPTPETRDELVAIASSPRAAGRVRVHARACDGSIGASKAAAAQLSRGKVLVELDHDDELTPEALHTVTEAFRWHPELAFVYSDWIDVEDRDGDAAAAALYPPGWGFGFGGYAKELVAARYVPVALAPAITWETVRHIVSMPNHLRAWRAAAYRRIGGHDPGFKVADDYELLVRTFLGGLMARVPRPLYVQHHGGETPSASRQRNETIQELVQAVASCHDGALDARARALGAIPHDGPCPLHTNDPLRAASALVDPPAEAAAARGEPLVSVVLAAPRDAGELERALDVILAQTYANLELLVVGVGELEEDVIEARADRRVRHWTLPVGSEQPRAAAANYAVKAMARGTRVAQLEPQESWAPDHLAIQLSRLRSRRMSLDHVSRTADLGPQRFH